MYCNIAIADGFTSCHNIMERSDSEDDDDDKNSSGDSRHLLPDSSNSAVYNILLIGASQNGKSALANFLVTGKSNMQIKNQTFQVGTGLRACTQRINSEIVTWKHRYLPEEAQTQEILEGKINTKPYVKTTGHSFKIIDTPGIGDANKEKEEEHMEMLYSALKKMRDDGEELSLALFVVKYPPFITKEYVEDIRFYRKLLPQLMQNNVMLAVTAVKNDPEWVEEQKVSGVDPKKNIEDIRQLVTDKLGKESPVAVVTLKSSYLSSDEKAAHQARNTIFEDCIILPKVPLHELRMPKTNKQLADDSRTLECLKGIKKAY